MPPWLKHLWDTRRLSTLLVAALVAVAVVVVLVWPITDLIAAHDVGLITGPKRAAALQVAREAVRTQLLTLGVGAFAAGALIFTAMNFTLARRTVELTEQGQVTDRYTKAIEQLGSDKLDVRIGGTYALERIARDSPRDHSTVMEVLAACIRENSRKDGPEPERGTDAPGQDRPTRAVRADIQAALTVIGRRDTTRDSGPRIDLTGAHLARADLSNAHLRDALLTRADLTDANLGVAHLYVAHLADADLTRARLVGADLVGANLMGARLVGADLWGADLTRADLIRADLTDADLTDAKLTIANLIDADLTRTDLARADLTGALYSLDARVPDGWVRDSDSGRLNRANDDAIADDPGADHPGDESPA